MAKEARALRTVGDDEPDRVGDDYEPPAAPAASHIPMFEGQPVEFAKAKVTSATGLETGDRVWKIDDIVTLVIECRVTGVDHPVNQTTGKLERIHKLKAIDALHIGASIETLREAGL